MPVINGHNGVCEVLLIFYSIHQFFTRRLTGMKGIKGMGSLYLRVGTPAILARGVSDRYHPLISETYSKYAGRMFGIGPEGISV